MPVNRKWPIDAVVDAVRKVRLRPRERITFEYVLLGGVTDRPEHARQVARLVRRSGLPAKVNLIAWNPGPGIPYAMPDAQAVDRFRAGTGVRRRAGVFAQAARTGHLRGVRSVEAHCGDLGCVEGERSQSGTGGGIPPSPDSARKFPCFQQLRAPILVQSSAIKGFTRRVFSGNDLRAHPSRGASRREPNCFYCALEGGMNLQQAR